MTPRYEKVNDYYIIDKETGIKLSFDDTIKRLNRTEILKNRCRRRNCAMVRELKKQREKAETTELKNALTDVINTRLDL